MDKAGFAECLGELCATKTKHDVHKVIEFGKSRIFISNAAFDSIAQAVQRILKKFHAEHPEMAGLDADKLYASLSAVKNAGKMAGGDFKDLLGIMAEKNIVAQVKVQDKQCYCSVDFRHSPDSKFMALVERAGKAIAQAGFSLLTQDELAEQLEASPADIKRVAAYLREQEDLRSLAGGFLLSRAMKDKLLAVLAGMKEDITIASLRDTIGVSRKYTLPMLEFFDSQGITQRVGDKRILVKHPD
jgi:selenocysteine-specific elongation factor